MSEVVDENQATIPLPLIKKGGGVSGVRFFFTTRAGGVSQGEYASLNLGVHVGDDPGAVFHNRSRLLRALRRDVDHKKTAIQSVCYVNQVHGVNTVQAHAWSATPPDADAMVTRQEGVVLAILTADCAPVLLADPQARVVGAAHAGWRGGMAGVLESCVGAMVDLGACRASMHALIGPCIHPPSYRVGHAFLETFLAFPLHKKDIECQKFFSEQKKDGTLLFDLPGYVRARLLFNGLPEKRVHDVQLCTYRSKNNFFSHRRATERGVVPCGRQVGAVFLE